MEARYLIIARYAEFSVEGKLNLIGGDIEKFYWDEYPAVQPILNSAARVLFDKEDLATDHKFKSCVQTLDGEQIAEGPEGTIGKMPMPQEMTQLGVGMILTFGGVVFPKAGWYKIVLIIDDNLIKEARFRVMTRAEEISLGQATEKALQETKDGNASDHTNQ